jgi:spectinomycin phosphotransferase
VRAAPAIEEDGLVACLAACYDVRAISLTLLAIGYDLAASVYQVRAADGALYFLKVRSASIPEPALLVPRALIDRGVPNILAPLATRSGELWCSCNGRAVVLYPWIAGESAMVTGLSEDQWREFGATLAAVHASGLETDLGNQLPVEKFALSSAAVVRQLLDSLDDGLVESETARRFVAFWRAQTGRIHEVLARAEELGQMLRSRSFDLVLCHADIHAGNILVGADGCIHLIDWDGPRIAPRERDLLFVIGSHIARAVTPREEGWFFAGYGPVAIDPDALIYFRYERIVEDLGAIGHSVLLDPLRGEEARAEEAALAMCFFAPGGDIDRAEAIRVDALPVSLCTRRTV